MKQDKYITLPGERWFPKESSFEDDMKESWGDWGVASEVETLKAVLLHRPGKEVEKVDASAVRFSEEPIDVKRMRAQHDNLAQIYRDHDVEVYYVEEQRVDRPNAMYCRDLIFMTPEGAIIARPGMELRRGEERYLAKALSNLGVPILKTINANGVFEGANAMWVDRHTVILATSSRTNKSGFEQVKLELERIGVTDIIHMQIPYSNIHIDGIMNIASEEHFMIHAQQVPYDVVESLKRKGFCVLEAPSTEEAVRGFACNFVALDPGKVIMPSGNPLTQEVLEKAGIKVIPLEMDEILKGRGAVHCLTAALKRG